MNTKFNQSNIKCAIVSALVFGSAGLSGASYADTVAGTGNLAVSADVLVSCSLTAGTLAFGTYSSILDADHDAAGTIVSTCTNGAGVKIKLGLGTASDVDTPLSNPIRNLTGDNLDVLTYGLFRDSARTLPWSSTDATIVADIGSGMEKTYNIYGRIDKLQSTAIGGNYSDTVEITMAY
ncbi:spore coat U domain-containing protein [bacterium]|nr:spore coat U domain-containing protein [bacterium]MDC1242984.1 spore coat U domain-containing protein [Amylibacter sp.]